MISGTWKYRNQDMDHTKKLLKQIFKRETELTLVYYLKLKL